MSGAGWAPADWSYPAGPGFYPGQSSYSDYPPQMTKEQEVDFLKNEAEAIKGQLGEIEASIHDLESGE